MSLPCLYCGFLCSKPTYTFPETYHSLSLNPHETLLGFFSCLLFPSLFPSSLPRRLLTGMKHKAVGRCGCSCEAGVPLVLADEILVCPKQQQGHYILHSAITQSHDLITAYFGKYLLFGTTLTKKVEERFLVLL